MSCWVAYSTNTSTQETPRYMSVAPVIAINVLKKNPYNKPHTLRFMVWPNASGHLRFPPLLPLNSLLSADSFSKKTPLLAWFWFTIGCNDAVVYHFLFAFVWLVSVTGLLSAQSLQQQMFLLSLGVQLMVIFDALSQHFVYCFLYLISLCKSEK